MVFVDEIVDFIGECIEGCKEKEYVVYEKNLMYYSKYLLTKKQLIQFMKTHEIANFDVFKIKDEIKVKRTLEIGESETNEM